MTENADKNRLISRIVDREDRPSDWTTLDDVARQDPGAWRELLFALRDDAEVRQAVDSRLAVADNVIVPATSGAGGKRWSTAAVLAVAGWLAAAVLALLWFGSMPWREDVPPRGSDSVPPADLVHVDPTTPGAQTALTDPTDEHVVGELPRLMVQARPIAGREEVEVIYIRRTVERMLVRQAYQLKVDESGQPFTVPADLTAYMPPRTY